jgi:hypothetical protein
MRKQTYKIYIDRTDGRREAMSQHATLDEALDYWRLFSAELSAPGFADDLVIVDPNGYLVMAGDVLFAA